MSRRIFITGNGTDVGKTLVSAVLVEALRADYWKPVQAGELENSDTAKVKSLVSNSLSKFHPEAYRLKAAMSPHAAAAREGIRIDLSRVILPHTDNTLVIEGAGGLLVPLNETDLVVDMLSRLGAETIVVSRTYLGSINHTLLTLEALMRRGLKVKGIVFNDAPNPESENFITEFAAVPCLGRIDFQNRIDRAAVVELAKQFESLSERS